MITIIIAVVAMCFVGCQSSKDFGLAKSDNNNNYGDIAFEYMGTLATEYKSRQAGSEGDTAVAIWIRDILKSYGYEGTASYSSEETEGLEEFKFKHDVDSKQVTSTSRNVSMTKRVANSKGEIILGGYYDNRYDMKFDTETIDGDGSYESGASIAALLTIAQNIQLRDSGYDITIALFGAGSYGQIGADEYVKKIDEKRGNNIKLMVNFSQIVGGTNMYMYSRDFSTDYNDFFYEIAAKNQMNAVRPPSNKNIAFAQLQGSPLNYFHVGMIGNHLPFLNRKIPTVNFMSFDWSDNSNLYNTEIKGQQNIYRTSDDKLATLVERCGGVEATKSKLNDVIKIALLALSDEYADGFDSALSTAAKQEIKPTTTYGVALIVTAKIILIAATIAIIMVMKNYVRKNKDKYQAVIADAAQEPIEKVEVFEEFMDNNSNNSNGSSGDSNKTDNTNNSDDVFEGF